MDAPPARHQQVEPDVARVVGEAVTDRLQTDVVVIDLAGCEHPEPVLGPTLGGTGQACQSVRCGIWLFDVKWRALRARLPGGLLAAGDIPPAAVLARAARP